MREEGDAADVLSVAGAETIPEESLISRVSCGARQTADGVPRIVPRKSERGVNAPEALERNLAQAIIFELLFGKYLEQLSFKSR